jgi:general secretion pathway protein C
MNATAWMDDFKTADGIGRGLVEHGPKLAVGLLSVALAVQAALLITSQAGSSSAVNSDDDIAITPQARTAPALNLNSILNAHLFGVATVANTNSAEAPQTSMPLILAGVIAQVDPLQGKAIIGATAGAARLVSVGGTITGGARLKSVYGDHVLIERGGATESLYLPRSMNPALTTTPTAQSTTPGQRLQSLASNNNTLFNGLARVQAVYTQGKLAGFRIFPGGRNSAGAFSQLGLQAGDLVTAINGSVLDDPNRASEIMQTLSNAGSASLTVTRGGQQQELNLNLASVADAAETAVAADAAAAAGNQGPGAFRGGPPLAGSGPGGFNRNRGIRGGPRTDDSANSKPSRDSSEE